LNLVLQATHRLIILMSRVLNLILSHQPKAELEGLLRWWSHYAPAENTLVAYGGTQEEFEKLSNVPRVFVTDPRLRRKHGREKQSWSGFLSTAADWLTNNEEHTFTHVYIAEFDHLPLVSDLGIRLVEHLQREQADVLGHGLRRVDGTSHVHYLHHLSDPEFSKFWQRISVRAEKQVVFHMIVTGSFWSRDAFMRVAAQPQDISAYVEIYLPTVAHHLGFRVRAFEGQNKCVFPGLVPGLSVDGARQNGCWTVHPIKTTPQFSSVGDASVRRDLVGEGRSSTSAGYK
jgi:hypothetical protein